MIDGFRFGDNTVVSSQGYIFIFKCLVTLFKKFQTVVKLSCSSLTDSVGKYSVPRMLQFYKGLLSFILILFLSLSVDSLDPEKLIQCPYDKNHQIRACRFPYHLIKCRKVRYYFHNMPCNAVLNSFKRPDFITIK